MVAGTGCGPLDDQLSGVVDAMRHGTEPEQFNAASGAASVTFMARTVTV